jgi:hypothetical protein
VRQRGWRCRAATVRNWDLAPAMGNQDPTPAMNPGATMVAMAMVNSMTATATGAGEAWACETKMVRPKVFKV